MSLPRYVVAVNAVYAAYFYARISSSRAGTMMASTRVTREDSDVEQQRRISHAAASQEVEEEDTSWPLMDCDDDDDEKEDDEDDDSGSSSSLLQQQQQHQASTAGSNVRIPPPRRIKRMVATRTLSEPEGARTIRCASRPQQQEAPSVPPPPAQQRKNPQRKRKKVNYVDDDGEVKTGGTGSRRTRRKTDTVSTVSSTNNSTTSIPLALQKVRDEKWGAQYKNLVQYKKKHGHTNVPTKGYAENPKLGIWVQTQRQQYRKWKQGKHAHITPERIEKLSKLGFVWELRKKTAWDERYQQLVQYIEQYGHANVPQGSAENPSSLGNWVKKQREAYQKFNQDEKSTMTQEQIDRLNQLGFVWDPWQEAWMERYKELVEYYKENGHVDVPARYAKNLSLGKWVNKQRVDYRRFKKNKPCRGMNQERIDKLNAIKFSWKLIRGRKKRAQ